MSLVLIFLRQNTKLNQVIVNIKLNQVRQKNFDVLNWWKRDQMYPTLQKIAKDILIIPVSSVASESAFSMGGRVISSHRSRLHFKIVETLMCLQNWMVDDIKVTENGEEDKELVDFIDMDVDDIESSSDMKD